MKGSCRGENVRVKCQDTRDVIETNSKIALFTAVHDEFLNHRGANLERFGELSQIIHKFQLDGFVDLGQLLKQSGQDNLLQRLHIFLHFRIGPDLRENRRDLLADGQGVEVHFENIVQSSNLWSNSLQQTLAQGVFEEHCSGGSCRHAKEVCQAIVLVLARFIDVNQCSPGSGCTNNRNGESG